MKTFTVDMDEDTGKWVVTKRDDDNMPLDQSGQYDTEKQARRAASQARYAAKVKRPR